MSPANVVLASPKATPAPVTAIGHAADGRGHDWRLVAPWYRWERLDGLEPERKSGANRPAFHKFASTEFVTDYLSDPQRSVLFDPDLDVAQDLVKVGPSSGSKLPSLFSWTREPSERRKFFLPAHQRFYVVSIGLHCDRPGFPKVDPAKVAEVGFVIRREHVEADDEIKTEAVKKVQNIAIARAKARTEFRLTTAKHKAQGLHPFRAPDRDRVQSAAVALLKAHQQVAKAKQEFNSWVVESGLETTTEGWVATGEGSFGYWVPVDDQPADVVERTYPMRLLTPDPDDPAHAALDGTIYWAAIPTASDEITLDGTARFDDKRRYRIQVYARYERNGCPGELVWSDPSEPFHLASFYDPDGCSLRPIDIQLPDFRQLEATNARPSVKMSSPPASAPHALASGEELANQGSEICFWFIPLITIIAMFVLNIFLPIVVFIFQLWWMLKLKFCIPPSADVDFDLEAGIGFEPGGFDASVDFDVKIAADGNVDDVMDALRQIFDPGGKAYQDDDEHGPPPFEPEYDFADKMAANFNYDSIIRMAMTHGYDGNAENFAMDFSRDPQYTTPVTRDQVKPPITITIPSGGGS